MKYAEALLDGFLSKLAEDMSQDTPDSVDDGSAEAPKNDENAKTSTAPQITGSHKTSKVRRKVKLV